MGSYLIGIRPCQLEDAPPDHLDLVITQEGLGIRFSLAASPSQLRTLARLITDTLNKVPDGQPAS